MNYIRSLAGIGGSMPQSGNLNISGGAQGIGGNPVGFSQMFGGTNPSFGSERANSGLNGGPLGQASLGAGGYTQNKIAGFGQGAPTMGALGKNYYGEMHGNGGARPGVKPQFNAVQQARMQAGMPPNNQPMPGQASPRQAVMAAYPHSG